VDRAGDLMACGKLKDACANGKQRGVRCAFDTTVRMTL
jgi:hypothetical protein